MSPLDVSNISLVSVTGWRKKSEINIDFFVGIITLLNIKCLLEYIMISNIREILNLLVSYL